MSDLNYFMTRKKVKVLGRFKKEYRGNYIIIWCSWLDIILYVIFPETKIYVKGYGVPKTVERKWNAYFKKNNYTNFIKEERK